VKKPLDSARLIQLDQLHEPPYANVICYPKLTQKELTKRLKELKQLQITAIEFTGKKTVHNIPILGKGCVGIVVKAFIDKEALALKIRRIDADRTEMRHEAEMLKKANTVKIGPKLLNASKNFLVMEYIEGLFLPEWLKKTRSKQKIRNVLRQALEQCWQLDKIGLDHGELSHAPKHIIIRDETPYIIDFETASTTRKTQNVTSLSQYFLIASGLAKHIEKKLGNIEKNKLIQASRNYKKAKTEENLKDVLKTVKLIW
jgi:putative serine/threonine protein kinase